MRIVRMTAKICAAFLAVAVLQKMASANTLKGISWNFQMGLEGIDNFSGGIQQGAVGNATEEGGLALNTGKAGLWAGGKFAFEFLGIQNGNPENYVGDLQGVSAYTGLSRGAVYKLYYRQAFGHANVRAGLISANDYFDSTGLASQFLNVSYGFTPTIGVNVPGASSYPYSSLGIMAAYAASGWTGMAGVFGGDAIHPFRTPFDRGSMEWLELDRAGHLGDGKYVVKLGGWENQQKRPYQATLAARRF